MTHSFRAYAPRLLLASIALSAFAVAGGCSDDTDAVGPDDSGTPNPPTKDAGRDASGNDDASPATDAGTDARRDQDACADGGCAPKQGCALFPNAAFCDDFDNADALTPGKTKWDFIEPSAQPVATLATDRAVSTPNSLLSQVIDKSTPGAKYAKTITKADFTEVTWSYDVYLDAIGSEDGFFLDDFQFSDAAGIDSFGFRLVMFAQGTAIKEFKVEHVRGANEAPKPTDYKIEDPMPAGTVMLGQWHHFEQKVKFTFAAAGSDAGADAGATDKVDYSLTIDRAAAPAFRKEYDAPARNRVTFARIAPLANIFNKERSAGLKIHWDNHVLEMK
jgi:hypothetical protein